MALAALTPATANMVSPATAISKISVPAGARTLPSVLGTSDSAEMLSVPAAAGVAVTARLNEAGEALKQCASVLNSRLESGMEQPPPDRQDPPGPPASEKQVTFARRLARSLPEAEKGPFLDTINAGMSMKQASELIGELKGLLDSRKTRSGRNGHSNGGAA